MTPIDARALFAGDGYTQCEEARELAHRMQTLGFAQLSGIFGLEPELRSCISKSLSFFQIPAPERIRLERDLRNPAAAHRWRGYAQDKVDGRVRNEFFDIGETLDTRETASAAAEILAGQSILLEPTPLPCGVDPDWPAAVMCCRAIFMRIAIRALEEVGIYFGVDRNYVRTLFAGPNLTTLRLIHYPSDDDGDSAPQASRPSAIRGQPHEDSSALSLVWQSAQGLELRDLHGNWHTAEPGEDMCSLHCGEVLAVVTRGALSATTHRVVVREGARQSIVCFLEPSANAPLLPWVPPVHGDLLASPPLYGSWLLGHYGLADDSGVGDTSAVDSRRPAP